MPIGIQNVTALNMTDILDIGTNVTEITDFYSLVNNNIYGGYLYFILLLTLWVILYFALQGSEDLPLHNIMWSGAIVTICSFIIRAIEITRDGVIQGMLSDQHMWIFPLVTVLLAAIVWMNKRDI